MINSKTRKKKVENLEIEKEKQNVIIKDRLVREKTRAFYKTIYQSRWLVCHVFSS